ncbi:alpha/beta-hydrolase [Clavulina sp. PMI_390]|nr:alpha/beta-hydrolase [Clavulina sp. PMI_390]
MKFSGLVCAIACFGIAAEAAPAKEGWFWRSKDKRASPTVTLDKGTFIGAKSSSYSDVSQFLGIPFAQPPVGNLRFALPVANSPYNGTYTVTSMGKACIQQALTLPLLSGLAADVIDDIVNSIFGAVYPDDEDCELPIFAPHAST